MAEMKERDMLSHPEGRRLVRAVRRIRKRLWLFALPITIALASLFATVPAYASTYLYSSNDYTYGSPACPNYWNWPAEKASLRFQCDGNLVIYGGIDRVDPIWATGTNGHPGDFAVMQDDSNFVIYASPGDPIWASGTEGRC